MPFSDRPAACGLEVAKRLVAKAGAGIDPEAVKMLKKSYVNDIIYEGGKDAVDSMIGDETWSDGVLSYNGTLQQIYDKVSFKIKVMVKNKESRSEVIKLLGEGVLGLPWNSEHNLIPFHMEINLSQKKGKTRLCPELSLKTISEIDDTKMTRRVLVSQFHTIHNPMGMMSPVTIKYKLLLQELSNKAGWDDLVEDELAEVARKILKVVVLMRDINFPRLVKPDGVLPGLELVCWWDGGNPASACGIYGRYELEKKSDEGYTHSVRLLVGKARVTPSSTTKEGSHLRESTPRAELRGLLILRYCLDLLSCLRGSL